MGQPQPAARPERIADVLAAARRRLAAAPFGPSSREAILLLSRVLDVSEAAVLAHGEAPLASASAERFAALLARRLEGEPMAYLLGEREFYGRVFAVDARVLIPRPETEHLIAAALELALPAEPWILDVGTGSGAIAVTLALELRGAQVVAGDRSAGALAVAAHNARGHRVADRVHPVAADLTAALTLSRLDLVVSNPPYLDLAERASLSVEITAYEPALALFSLGGALTTIERLLAQCRELRPGTPLLLEIGAGQLETVCDAAATRGFDLINAIADYAGIDRVVVLRRRPAG
jgi:release factor glutamine methyltransferase